MQRIGGAEGYDGFREETLPFPRGCPNCPTPWGTVGHPDLARQMIEPLVLAVRPASGMAMGLTVCACKWDALSDRVVGAAGLIQWRYP